jgi:hypothetical protein
MIVDPDEAVSKLVDGISLPADTYMTYTDEPVLDGPTTSSNVGLADLLRRRQDETERLLARGGIVVVFAYPDVAHPRVAGFTGCHRYYWLPAPAGSDYGPRYLKPATGTQVRPTDYMHPFADYLERLRGNVLYRVAFAEGGEGFGSGAKVIGRSPGGAAVALEIAVGGGRVVFLPALPRHLSSTDRSALASSLVAALRNALLLDAEEGPPDWLDDYSLPGIEAAQERIDEAESKVEELEAELDEARNEYRGIDRYRRLLWQEGKYGLDLPVRDALELLGFVNVSTADEPASFRYDGEPVYLETEASLEAVGMQPHYRLRERIESRIATSGERPLGIVVVNGYRALAPSARPEQYTDALRIAAESMRYCVVESSRLLEAVRAKLQGKGDTAAFCQSLIATEGVLPPVPLEDEESAAAPEEQETKA